MVAGEALYGLVVDGSESSRGHVGGWPTSTSPAARYGAAGDSSKLPISAGG